MHRAALHTHHAAPAHDPRAEGDLTPPPRARALRTDHFNALQSERACVQYCTASLGCLGVTTAPRKIAWTSSVPNYPRLTINGYSFGCDIITTHRAMMVRPEGEVTWLPGDDVKCTDIQGGNANTERGQQTECRRARQSALLG